MLITLVSNQRAGGQLLVRGQLSLPYSAWDPSLWDGTARIQGESSTLSSASVETPSRTHLEVSQRRF